MKIACIIIAIATAAILISGNWGLLPALFPIICIAIFANLIIKNQNRIQREQQVEQAKRDIDDIEWDMKNHQEDKP